MLEECGVTLEQAAKALTDAMKLLPPLPPPGDAEIMMIKNNPSLNFFQKRRLSRLIKKGGRHEQK